MLYDRAQIAIFVSAHSSLTGGDKVCGRRYSCCCLCSQFICATLAMAWRFWFSRVSIWIPLPKPSLLPCGPLALPPLLPSFLPSFFFSFFLLPSFLFSASLGWPQTHSPLDSASKLWNFACMSPSLAEAGLFLSVHQGSAKTLVRPSFAVRCTWTSLSLPPPPDGTLTRISSRAQRT